MSALSTHRAGLRPGLGAVCAAFFILSCFADSSLTGTGVREGYLLGVGSGPTPSAMAVAHAAGEFRIAAANIIWLNVVDHYHHQYIAQGGDWSRNKAVLPLLHIIVILDPHFIQAYDVGSLILCRLRRFNEASALLDQGVAANPTDWGLVYDEAMMKAWYTKNPAAALPDALKADSLATDAFDKRRLNMFVHTLRNDIAQHRPTH